LKIDILDLHAFMSKIPIYAQNYLCFMILLISSHTYGLIFKTCPSMTYMCSTIDPMPKSFAYLLFGQFLIFPELPRQFEDCPGTAEAV
jgi:hypothetical protein